MMTTVPGACNHGEDFTGFDALTVARTGSLALDLAPEKALPLFTAQGERLWIPIWDPVILHGDGYETGTVFVTENHGQTTYWLVVDYDTDARRARYARVRPGADAGTVDVSIAPNGSGGSIVTVGYRLTGLSHAGNVDLQDFTEARYAEMMHEWRAMIESSREKIDEHFGR